MADSEYRNAGSPYFIDFLVKVDARGKLTSLEFSSVPFQVNRYFTISVNDTGFTRGSHAHKKCWQAFFACYGGQRIVVKNLSGAMNFDLGANKLLILPPYNWCEVRFETKDSIMGAFASLPYDQEDYLVGEPPLMQ
jgi:hypothetical protein